MRNRHSALNEFVIRSHRRHVAIHVLERGGLGLLGGCALGLALVLIAMLRGLPTMPLLSAAMVAGAALGLFVGVLTRPSRFETAVEVDRQLNSADLLGSALTLRESAAEDVWRNAVLAAAERWCAGASPSVIVFHRLGARAWGGVGLAGALAVAIALLPAAVTPTQARNVSLDSSNSATAQAESRAMPAVAGRTILPTHFQPEPEDLNPSRMAWETLPPDRDSGSAPRADSEHQDTTLSGQVAAAGTGQAESRVDPRPQSPLASASTGSNANSVTGETSSGGGRASRAGRGTSDSESSRVARETAHADVPPWRSDSWPAQAARADHELESGVIPDEYREIVRAYFQPGDPGPIH